MNTKLMITDETPSVSTPVFTDEPTGLWFSLSFMWEELGAYAETDGDFTTADFFYDMADTAESLTAAFAADSDTPLDFL